jgi:hypothetical protein
VTPSEELVSRYAKVERQVDAFGRCIGVRRLKISQQTKVSEMTPGLEGEFEVTLPASPGIEADPDRGVEAQRAQPERTVKLSRRTQMLVAAAVCEIDAVQIPFARSRGELDAIADRLDEEGLVAAMVAYARLQPKRDAEADEGAIDKAKK